MTTTQIRTIPEGVSGIWSIQRFTVSPEAAAIERWRLWNPSSMGRHTPEGTYTKLCRNGHVIMSDTPDELDDLRPLKRMARGRVLINGLGLGCAVQLCLDKPEVEHIDVVEIDADVLALVRSHYEDPRVTFHEADVFSIQWERGRQWDAVWHDIWDSISADNLAGMTRLHRKYGRRCNWQGSWCRVDCLRAKARWS